MSRSVFGSIDYVREGAYRVRWEAGFDPVTGKRRRKSKTVYGTRKDAERFLAARALDSGKGPANALAEMTLDQYWEADYSREVAKLAPGTVNDYAHTWQTYLRPILGDEPIGAITARTARQRLLSLAAPGAQNKAHKLLRQMLNVAAADGIIDVNPLPRTMRLDKITHRVTATYLMDEIPAVLEALRGTDIEPMVLCSLMGGLRREEACALRWGDLAFNEVDTLQGKYMACYVKVMRTAQLIAGEVVVGPTKTERSTRTVVIGGVVAERLSQLSAGFQPTQWMNPSKKEPGACGNPQTVASRWRTVCANAGLRHVPFTGLRATYSTMQQELGTPDTLVSMMMGHTQLGTRYKHYLSANLPAMEQAAAVLGRAVS